MYGNYTLVFFVVLLLYHNLFCHIYKYTYHFNHTLDYFHGSFSFLLVALLLLFLLL